VFATESRGEDTTSMPGDKLGARSGDAVRIVCEGDFELEADPEAEPVLDPEPS